MMSLNVQDKLKADEHLALMVDFDGNTKESIPPVKVISSGMKGGTPMKNKASERKSDMKTNIMVDRNRLLCSARLAVAFIVLALVLGTCSVWLCLDIRAMQMNEAGLVKQLKELIEGLYNRGALYTDDLDSKPYLVQGSDDYSELNFEKFLKMLDYDETDLSGVKNAAVTTTKSAAAEKIKFIDIETSTKLSNNELQCDLIPDSWRFDCHPETGASEEACVDRGCCWKTASTGSPTCFYPQNFPGYVYVNSSKTETGLVLFLKLNGKPYYPDAVALLRMDVMFETNSRLHIKISDANVQRYEVPLILVPQAGPAATNPDYDLKFLSNSGFQVIRRSTGEIIFDASVGAFIFCDQFIQLSAVLPSTYVYGLGERQASFVQDFDWSRFTLFNADQVPRENANLYGSHPFYLMMEGNGQSNGVFLLNSNALEITLQPTPAITYRTIGGILDFYFFMGPQPEDVIKQYTEVVQKPFLPPYWGLGFHLCRFNYGTVEKTRSVWNRTRESGIPFDVQWNDLDYMVKRRDFTVDLDKFGNLSSLVDEIHSVGMHYIPIIDCAIGVSSKEGEYPVYDQGVKMDIFIKDESGRHFIGKVWPGDAVWPDFTNPNTSGYWTVQFEEFQNKIPFDGAWIDMNEPSNFLSGGKNGCSNNRWDNPPYVPQITGNKLSYLTVCMSAQQHASIHYNVHNLYGLSETISTNLALASVRRKRPFTISRSSFPGHGHWGGVWSGDIGSDWHDMRRTISSILSFSLFGIPLSGADICGFNGNTTVKLCQRWMELGAFYPFSRNHNTDDAIDQDPVALGPEVVKASLKAYMTRYALLPYLYTLFYRATVDGATVVRPLFFEFPNDRKTYTIDTQFLWGSGLMILPVLEEDVTRIFPYFPLGWWYLLPSSEVIQSRGSNYGIESPLDTISIAARGGYIIPFQGVNKTTTASRLQSFGLLAALNESGSANGELFWDDGDSIETLSSGHYNLFSFSVLQNSLTSNILVHGYHDIPMILGNVTILGVQFVPSVVTINGDGTPFEFNNTIKALKVVNLNIDMANKFSINWK